MRDQEAVFYTLFLCAYVCECYYVSLSSIYIIFSCRFGVVRIKFRSGSLRGHVFSLFVLCFFTQVSQLVYAFDIMTLIIISLSAHKNAPFDFCCESNILVVSTVSFFMFHFFRSQICA